MYEPQINQQSTGAMVYGHSVEEIVYKKTLGMYEGIKKILREFISLTGECLETKVYSLQEIEQKTPLTDYPLKPEIDTTFFAKRKSSGHGRPKSNKQKKKYLREKKRNKIWRGYSNKKKRTGN